jgi:hypothetical protein
MNGWMVVQLFRFGGWGKTNKQSVLCDLCQLVIVFFFIENFIFMRYLLSYYYYTYILFVKQCVRNFLYQRFQITNISSNLIL